MSACRYVTKSEANSEAKRSKGQLSQKSTTSDALSVRDAGISDAMASYDDANFHVSVPANDAKSWNSLIGIVIIEALVHFGNWWGRY